MNSPPRVSVVMPVYNTAAYIAEGIGSILAQPHRPLEVIVVDDGSTDGSGAIAASFGDPVRCHRQANAGPPCARNRGLGMARGDVIAFLDADDLFAPDKLAQQLPRLARNPGADVVIGGRQYQRLTSGADAEPRFAALEDDHLALQLGCAIFRRSVFERVGLFDEAMRYCDDWDWFMRAREQRVGLLVHRDVVLHQRIHTANITRHQDVAVGYQLRMFKRSLDRRRAGGAAAAVLPPLSSFLEPDPAGAEGIDG